MKKILILLAAMTLVTGFAMAQIGLTASLEGGVKNVGKVPDGDGKMEPWVTPKVDYTYPLMDGALDLNATLGFPLAFGEDMYFDGDGEPSSLKFGLIFNIGAVYHLAIGEAGKLDLGLAHEIDSLTIIGNGEDMKWVNTIHPSVRYGHTLAGIGELYGNLNLQFRYFEGPIDGEDMMSFYTDSTSIGWNSEFGLGVSVFEKMLFWAASDLLDSPDHRSFGFVISYDFTPAMSLPLVAQVETEINKKVDVAGIRITPKVTYTIMDGLKAWVFCDLEGIASDGGDIAISPALGVSYAF